MANKTILVCIDGSEISDYAFHYALDQVYNQGDTILLLTVPEFDVSLSALGSDWEKVVQLVAKNKEGIDTLYSKYMSVVREKSMSGRAIQPQGGKAGEVICQTARQEGASHIVMGTRGLGKLQRAFLGSVSNYVLNHADLPVTIVPKHK